MSAAINLSDKLALFQEHWSPKIIADFNDCEVRIAKFQGPFTWHSHDESDEMFLVIDGELILEFRDKTVRLLPGEMVIVPKGVEHRPNCTEECQVMMLIKAGSRNTGAATNAFTVDELDRL